MSKFRHLSQAMEANSYMAKNRSYLFIRDLPTQVDDPEDVAFFKSAKEFEEVSILTQAKEKLQAKIETITAKSEYQKALDALELDAATRQNIERDYINLTFLKRANIQQIQLTTGLPREEAIKLRKKIHGGN